MSSALTSTSGDPAQSETSRNGGVLQVTIDAGSTASGMMNFSVNVLARISRTGIDTFTFGVAVVVGSQIDWSPKGCERFYDALRKAPVRNGYGNVLWFGFGHKSPIQILGETDGGSKFAAICACLTETYSASMAAQIVMTFTKLVLDKTPDPRPPLPSLDQMHKLVEKCAGIFSTSNFPLWAEQYMSFDGEKIIGQHAWPTMAGKARYSRGVSAPADIADALYELTELSNGNLQHLVLAGVADAGLVAAIGAWLFGLRVVIYAEDDNEENLRFRNMNEDEAPQLTVVYTRHDSRASLTMREKTVRLSNVTVIIKSHAQEKPNQDRVLGGRVHWKRAFEGTFGEDFKRLLGIPTLFGAAVGSAARILSALVHAEEDVPETWLRHNNIYFPDSFGQSLVEFTRCQFPELSAKSLRVEMDKAARASSYQDAQTTFEGSIDGLANICGCGICCYTGSQSAQAGSALPGNTSNTSQPKIRYCYPAIAITLVRLSRALSGISALEGLHPKRAGLEYIYKTTETRIRRLRRESGRHARPIICSIVEHGIPDMTSTEVSLLRLAQHIYGGQTFHDEGDDPGSSAVAIEGLCYYLDILREPLQDDPISLARINVIPGHIQYNGSLYHRVGEKSTDLFKVTSPVQARPQDCVPKKAVTAIEHCFQSKFELLVTEEIKHRRAALAVDYGFLDKAGVLAQLGPARSVRSICRSSGLIMCRNDGCQQSHATARALKTKLAGSTVMAPVCKLMINDSEVTIFDIDHAVLLLAAFGCWEPIFQRGECLACCVRTGCKNGWSNFAVVCTRLSGGIAQQLSAMSGDNSQLITGVRVV